MLYESDVISSVSQYLRARKYEILQELTETQKGDDIVARDSDGTKCFIEAKGETSSQKTSKRYGKAFSSSQVAVHVSKAVYRAIQMKEENSSNCMVGIALPDTPDHKKVINRITRTLELLSIAVFWVSNDRSVQVQGDWKAHNHCVQPIAENAGSG